jgi:hypothetical protein
MKNGMDDWTRVDEQDFRVKTVIAYDFVGVASPLAPLHVNPCPRRLSTRRISRQT